MHTLIECSQTYCYDLIYISYTLDKLWNYLTQRNTAMLDAESSVLCAPFMASSSKAEKFMILAEVQETCVL